MPDCAEQGLSFPLLVLVDSVARVLFLECGRPECYGEVLLRADQGTVHWKNHPDASKDCTGLFFLDSPTSVALSHPLMD